MPATPHNVWKAMQAAQRAERKRTQTCKHSTTNARRRWPTPRSAAGAADAKLLAGGQSLLRGDEARARGAGGAGRPGRHRRAARASRVDGDTVTIGAMTTHAEVAASKDVQQAIPALADAGRRHRRPPGAQPRHARRQPGQQRPGGRATRPPCSAWARRSRPTSATIAADDFFKGLYETALQDGEIITVGELPGAARRPAGRSSSSRRRASRSSACSSARAPSGVRVAVTGAGAVRVPRQGAGGQAGGELVGRSACDGVKIDADGLNSDLHGSAEYRAALIPVLAGRAVG